MEENINQTLESFFSQQDRTISISKIAKKISRKPFKEYIQTIQPNQCIVQECNIILYNTDLNGQEKNVLAETINKELQKMNVGYDQIMAIVGYSHNKEYLPNKPYNISAYLVLKNDNPSRNL